MSGVSGRSRHRVLIVDDHELARAGLRTMLLGAPGLEVIGEAADGAEALELCRRLLPHLVLMDVRMPGANGLDVTRVVKRLDPSIIVLIVTMYDSPDYLYEAVRAGAAGYVLKDATSRELLRAVRRVLAGESLLASEQLASLTRRLAGASPPAELIEPLTAREREVLQLVVQGKTNREIAHHLCVSAGTAKIHVQHIIAKLNVSDRTQAAVRAVELGLLNAEPA
ncbi:MAG TPA: response regulator transcription factor [Ktedonobacterales bacterium]|nr:response regulator transcription factor [Ktedonobacterales bacterium]